MKNKEFYFDEIVKRFCSGDICPLATKILRLNDCSSITCEECAKMVAEAMEEEYVPDIDWTKIPKDTLVEVSNYEDFSSSYKRYFKNYDAKDGIYWCYKDGATSETNVGGFSGWDYCRLAKDEDIKKYSRWCE